VIATPDGREVGTVTSGGFGPTVNGPIAMGYVSREVSAPGTELDLMVRGKPLRARVAPLPFTPHRYKR
jgi:aminomethyltransferase